MQRILITILLSVAALSAASAAVCVRGECSAGCSDAQCTPTGRVVVGGSSGACCAPVIAGQSSIVPVRAGHDEWASMGGDGPVAAGKARALSAHQIARLAGDTAGTAAITQAGQTIYLRTGRLRL
jgi:hypothetical protein